jgi:hypothetical protein
VICSKNLYLRNQIIESIENTIGVLYELIIIDNLKNEYSLFSAYNKGISLSSYNIICFMHEDIIIHTSNWGLSVLNHFENPEIGLIGIAGTHFLPNCPSAWPMSNLISMNILQTTTERGTKKTFHAIERVNKNNDPVEVVSIDGVWFCTNKKVTNQLNFDELNFSGYHFYDIDFCLGVRSLGLKNFVIFDILLEHFSYGSYNLNWLDNSRIFYEKWKHRLPQNAGILISDTEKNKIHRFVTQLYDLQHKLIKLKIEKNKLLNSRAYLLGKFIINLVTGLNKINCILIFKKK